MGQFSPIIIANAIYFKKFYEGFKYRYLLVQIRQENIPDGVIYNSIGEKRELLVSAPRV
jgi:hypothetical protein